MKAPKRTDSVSANMRAKARELRANPTFPERMLWQLLRDRRLAETKFRRQHVVGPYIVDFYCPSQKLVVELDGRSHHDRGIQDQERQNYLESVGGLRVFRVDNDDVLHDRESVILGLLKVLGIKID